MNTFRDQNLKLLKSLGFLVAPSLPRERTEGPAILRPPFEIAAQLLALGSTFLWATDWGEEIPTEELDTFVTANRLTEYLAPRELAIVQMNRSTACQAHSFNIGWRLENMWPLAWILGFETKPPLHGMIDHPTIEALLVFMAIPKLTPVALANQSLVQSVATVDELEDLFYCAHNAVRSAQLGGHTVPKAFHPIVDGGCIHERRHALTWALSPAIKWEETDLST